MLKPIFGSSPYTPIDADPTTKVFTYEDYLHIRRIKPKSNDKKKWGHFSVLSKDKQLINNK